MVTHDLVQQFLAFGSDAEVLKPAHLRKTIAKELAGALVYYRKNDNID